MAPHQPHQSRRIQGADVSFEAKYVGYCCSCDDLIHVGDLAVYALDDVVVHADCEDSARPERKAEVCAQCWLTMPCDCEADK